MSKGLIILVLAFIVVFAAGVAGGLVVRQSAQPPDQKSWLSSELGLTPEQQEKMRAIWAPGDRQRPGQSFEQIRAVWAWRDKSVQELLTEEQRARYDQIVKEADQKLAAITAERKKGFEEKAARTKEILTPEQREKFEALLQKEFVPGGPPLGGGPGHGHWRPSDGRQPLAPGAGAEEAKGADTGPARQAVGDGTHGGGSGREQ
jgi:Spy/CpxP family protein refolding chaperone